MDERKLIYADDAIRWIKIECNPYGKPTLDFESGKKVIEYLERLPSAQPEITDKQAIEHLQSTGWMQNHDKQMYEMGLKEKLADDSGSYDSLMPSAQPEHLVKESGNLVKGLVNDCISRQAVLDKAYAYGNGLEPEGYCVDVEDIQALPSVQPESRREWYMHGYRDAQDAAMHESCTDCPLYDHDRHNCPRFNKVIPTAIRDAQPRWIPVTERLPEDGLYIVTTSKGQVQVHVFSHNGNSEEYWMRCNKAWMPLPEPYKEGQDE